VSEIYCPRCVAERLTASDGRRCGTCRTLLALPDATPRVISLPANQVEDRVEEPSRELSALKTSTRSSSTRSNALLGPDDLKGERLKALDHRPEVQEALARIGVAGVDDYASRVSRRPPRRRNGPLFAIWKLDLYRAAGLIQPLPVDLPPLPTDASDSGRLMRDRYAVLLGLRRLRGDGEDPAPYTKQFAAEWCGLSDTTAQRALGELLRAGVIVKVGTCPTRGGGAPTSLYLPGSTAP
jgi:hypothetical protein